MDIIDKIFSKLQKQKAPSYLTASILDIPEKAKAKKASRWFVKGLVPALLAMVLIFGAVAFGYSL